MNLDTLIEYWPETQAEAYATKTQMDMTIWGGMLR